MQYKIFFFFFVSVATPNGVKVPCTEIGSGVKISVRLTL